jgi:hypothetical protein
MRKSTSINFKAVLIALFVVSLGIEMVSAAGFPSVKDLYGRYKFSGECSYVDMVSGAARLRFLLQRIIIWPCCRANQRMK